MAFKRLADRFCRFSTVKQTRAKRRTIVNENNVAAILAFVALNPHASIRQMEKKSGISQRAVLRILHQHKFHPDVSFLIHVLFSDKANFANTGNVNRHNMPYWENENFRWMRTVPFQHPWSVNCWCGIVRDHVIGPYFFEGRLTGQVYANFLQNVLPQLMENVPLYVRMNMWMQHDGEPPNYALCLRQVMNGIFDEKWIGRGGPVAWPPHSPDLTSPDYS